MLNQICHTIKSLNKSLRLRPHGPFAVTSRKSGSTLNANYQIQKFPCRGFMRRAEELIAEKRRRTQAKKWRSRSKTEKAKGKKMIRKREKWQRRKKSFSKKERLLAFFFQPFPLTPQHSSHSIQQKAKSFSII